MALKLTKAESERQAALVVDMRKAEADVQNAIGIFNEALENARVDFRDAVSKYNDVISEVNGFAADIASRIEEEIDSKSEKWQEGEKGEAASEWKGAWEEIDFEELDADQMTPQDIEDFNTDDPDTLEGISIEPEGSY